MRYITKNYPTFFKFLILPLVLLVLLGAFAWSSSQRANAATTLGNTAWPHTPGQTTTLYWFYHTTLGQRKYYSQAHFAQNAWNQAADRVELKEQSGGPVNIFVRDEPKHNDNYYGLTWVFWGTPCPATGCLYSHAEIALYTNLLDKDGEEVRKKVVTHEFGHALGLAHPPADIQDTVPSVMGPGPSTTPQEYDKNDINNTLYR